MSFHPVTSDHLHGQAILRSLTVSPLLLGNLPEADAFPQKSLALPGEIAEINFSQKLGHLYEDALAQIFRASPPYEVCARNLQIQKDAHHTLGELDFLLRGLENGQLLHLELATKFYLARKTPAGITFPGPDARDNFHKKLQRLRTHQLVLTRNHRAFLPPEFRAEKIETRHLIHGCLFDHVNAKNLAQPEFANPNCRRGKWLSADELPNQFPPGTRFEIIPKHLRPVPLDLLKTIPLQNWNPKEPVTRCQTLRINDSTSPYFVTPTGWPKADNT